MKRRFVCTKGSLGMLVAALACTTAAACSPFAQEKAGMEFKRNPDPTQAFRITMTIKDAPGPFDSMRALAHYDVVNRECLRPPKDNPGGHTSPVPTAPTEFAMERIADGVYAGVVYADLMLDEDYTGHGVCHWQLTSVVVQMKATGADGETLFVPSISDEKLLAAQPETVYFNKSTYPRAGMDNFPDTGLSDRSRFGPSIQDDDLFTVTFTASKEATP